MAATVFALDEEQSALYEWDLVDELGAVVPVANLTSLKLTLYDVATDTIINDREDQDVLNTNDVTFDSSGHGMWSIQPADNAIQTDTVDVEKHVALFVATWAVGTKSKPHEVVLNVRNLRQVPATP
jgi:hypothetical protein